MIIKNKLSIKDTSKIIKNKKAYYNFFIEKKIESGLILQGWEVKSIRANRVDISNSYLLFKNFEVYLIGIKIQPIQILNFTKLYKLNRNIKVLLNKKEINYLYNKYKINGYSLIALDLHWKKSWCKLNIGIAKGKSKQDKRLHIKNKEWNIQKNMIIKKILK